MSLLQPVLTLNVPNSTSLPFHGHGHRLIPLSELSGKSSKMLLWWRVRVTNEARSAEPPWYLNSPPPRALLGRGALLLSPANGIDRRPGPHVSKVYDAVHYSRCSKVTCLALAFVASLSLWASTGWFVHGATMGARMAQDGRRAPAQGYEQSEVGKMALLQPVPRYVRAQQCVLNSNPSGYRLGLLHELPEAQAEQSA